MSGDAQQSQPPDDLYTQAGEYVLGTLDAGQRRSIEARMPYEPALRKAVQEWEQRLLPLTALAEPVDPGASLWRRIAASITPKTQRPAVPSNVRWWQLDSLTLWRSLTGAGFAAAAVLAAVLVVREASPPAAPRYFVVLAAPQSQSPGWLVQAQVEGRLQLVPLGTDKVPAEKSLQFWTKADGWSAPVSLGLVTPGQSLEIPVDKLPALQPNQLFELTLEPYGGSPIGRPTGPIQFIGRAVQI